MIKFAIKTLGCKVNRYDEQAIRERLVHRGHSESALENADVFIVNSCTVTSEADRKTLNLIRSAKNRNPHIHVVVTGCYAVADSDVEKLRAMPEVDTVVSGKDKMSLPEVLSGLPSDTRDGVFGKGISSFYGKTRAFLKIQDGCDRRCSYCKVGIVRGPSVSRPYSDVISELNGLVSNGYREIVLTGICVGAWKTRDCLSLAELVRRIDELEGVFRVRISSIEPDHIDARLIKAFASSRRLCKHFHIPLQSGDDILLKSMKRRYTAALFRDVVSGIRSEMPMAGISLDVIAGFPGETPVNFNKNRKLIEEVKPSRLHVFSYSDRPGTPASHMKGKVQRTEVKKRVNILIRDGKTFQEDFYNMFVGKKIEVLFEGTAGSDNIYGYTGEYVRVRSESNKGFSPGDISQVTGKAVIPAGPFLMAA